MRREPLVARLFTPLYVAWHWLRWGYYAYARNHVAPLDRDLFALSQRARSSREIVIGYFTRRRARRLSRRVAP